MDEAEEWVAGKFRGRTQAGMQRAQGSNVVVLVGEGLGEACDQPVGNAGLRLQRLTTAAEVAVTLAESAHTVCGMVVRQGSPPQLGIETLMAMRLASRHASVAAVVRRGDTEFRRSALTKRARCVEDESGEEATWRAARYVSLSGAQGPRGRRHRVEGFTKGHGLTPAQREYVDLISRDIPLRDMAFVFGVSQSTKKFHFDEMRERVGAASREEWCWVNWNDKGR